MRNIFLFIDWTRASAILPTLPVVDERPKIPSRNMAVAVLRFDGLRRKAGEAAVSPHCVAI
jgi:hypothetical protein